VKAIDITLVKNILRDREKEINHEEKV